MDIETSKKLDRIVTDEAKKLSERFFIDPLDVMDILYEHLTTLYYRNPEGYRQLFDRLINQIWEALKNDEQEAVLQYYKATPTSKLIFNPFFAPFKPQELDLEDQLVSTSIEYNTLAQESILLFRPAELQEQQKLSVDVPKESLIIGSYPPFNLPGYLFYAVVVIAQYDGKVITESEFGEKYIVRMHSLKQTHKMSDDAVKNLSRYASDINKRLEAQGLHPKWKLLLNRRSVGYQINPVYRVEILS